MDINDYFYAWKPALFRKKTRGMTTLQKGIYRELIDEYMLTREPLPADDNALADIARVSLEIWNENKAEILTKFDEQDGLLFHEHCNEELDFQDKDSRKKSKAGKKAASIRWKHKKKPIMRNECEPDANAMRFDATGQDRTGQDKDTVVAIGAGKKFPHVAVGKRIAQITGWENDPNWFGDYSRVETWLAQGFDPEKDIYPTVTRLMARRERPPKTMSYFEQAIADAHAKRIQPVKEGNPNAENRPSSNYRTGKSERAKAAILEGLGFIEPEG